MAKRKRAARETSTGNDELSFEIVTGEEAKFAGKPDTSSKYDLIFAQLDKLPSGKWIKTAIPDDLWGLFADDPSKASRKFQNRINAEKRRRILKPPGKTLKMKIRTHEGRRHILIGWM